MAFKRKNEAKLTPLADRRPDSEQEGINMMFKRKNKAKLTPLARRVYGLALLTDWAATDAAVVSSLCGNVLEAANDEAFEERRGR